MPAGTEKEPMYPIKDPAFLSPWFSGGRRTEICRSMGTKTFTVFEGIPQDCISGFDDEWQTEQLSGRYRGTGTGTL